MVSLPDFMRRGIPTLFTLSALGSGLTAVRLSIDGEFNYAFLFLIISAIFDGLDGHAARALNATSAFGAELDSLCDLVDFGVSPVIVVYMWVRTMSRKCDQDYAISDFLDNSYVKSDIFLWICCMIYTSACACRLARFNLSETPPVPQPPHSTRYTIIEQEELKEELIKTNSSETLEVTTTSKRRSQLLDDIDINGDTDDDDNGEVSLEDLTKNMKWLDKYINKSKFFEGVPAPAAAFLSLVPLMIVNEHPNASCDYDLKFYVALWFIFIGFLMICSLYTFSSKMLIRGKVRGKDPRTSHLHSKNLFTAMAKVVFVSLMVYLLITAPWRVSFYVAMIYLISIPIGHLTYHLLLTHAHDHKD